MNRLVSTRHGAKSWIGQSIYVVPVTQSCQNVLLMLYKTGEAVNEGHIGVYVIQSIAPLLSQICFRSPWLGLSIAQDGALVNYGR